MRSDARRASTYDDVHARRAFAYAAARHGIGIRQSRRRRAHPGVPRTSLPQLVPHGDHVRAALHGALQPDGREELAERRAAAHDQRGLRRHLRRRVPGLRARVLDQRPARRPHRRPQGHPDRRDRRDGRERGDGALPPPRAHVGRGGRRAAAARVQRALRREHVLPELRRRLDREGQRPLVPRPRARRVLRHLRGDDLERPVPRVHGERLVPRARREALPGGADPVRRLLRAGRAARRARDRRALPPPRPPEPGGPPGLRYRRRLLRRGRGPHPHGRDLPPPLHEPGCCSPSRRSSSARACCGRA